MRWLESMLLIFALGGVLRLAQWRRERKKSGASTERTPAVSKQPSAHANIPPLSAVPDKPLPFGYKTGWLAVRCDEPERVMDALSLFNQRTSANWETGLRAAAAGGGTFVTPCLDGWVLAVLYDAAPRGLVEAIAGDFPEVQYFCTHRVTEYHTWVRYLEGVVVRAYEYAGDQGEVLWEEGEWTAEEIALGFDSFPCAGKDWADAVRLPDEEDVLDIAAAWGADPRMERTVYPPSLGWVCQ